MRIVVCKYSRLDEHDRGIVKPYCSWSLKEAKYIKKVLLNLNVFFFVRKAHIRRFPSCFVAINAIFGIHILGREEKLSPEKAVSD